MLKRKLAIFIEQKKAKAIAVKRWGTTGVEIGCVVAIDPDWLQPYGSNMIGARLGGDLAICGP